jgi:rubrerythrin
LNEDAETLVQSFSMAELLVHALVIEMEAVESYKELAVQMRECGNDDVAGLFDTMSCLEAGHAAKIEEKIGDQELPDLAPWEYRWAELESPESIDLADIHYLMTPHHALSLALQNEMDAMAFFDTIAKQCTDEGVRSLATEFADDERQHVAWMEDWLAKYPPPDDDWHNDPDPPAGID